MIHHPSSCLTFLSPTPDHKKKSFFIPHSTLPSNIITAKPKIHFHTQHQHGRPTISLNPISEIKEKECEKHIRETEIVDNSPDLAAEKPPCALSISVPAETPFSSSSPSPEQRTCGVKWKGLGRRCWKEYQHGTLMMRAQLMRDPPMMTRVT